MLHVIWDKLIPKNYSSFTWDLPGSPVFYLATLQYIGMTQITFRIILLF